jgi:hypothetical protein
MLEHGPAREVRIEAEFLRQVAEARPQSFGMLQDVDAVEIYSSRRGFEQPGEDFHERRLAGAVGAEKAEHPRSHVERNSLQGGHGTRVDLDEIANREHGVRESRSAGEFVHASSFIPRTSLRARRVRGCVESGEVSRSCQ